MTKEELREFAGKYLGEEMEFSDSKSFCPKFTSVLTTIDISSDTGRMYACKEEWYHYCRPIQPKETRLMTVEELWGRTLVKVMASGNVDAFIVNTLSIDSFRLMGAEFRTIQELYDLGWKVNDKPTMEGATSLMVEVSE